MTETIRDIRQQPFYWIDRHFMPVYGQRIGPHAIAVYNALVYRSDRAGKAFPGMADLAKLTGIKSKHTLLKALKTLQDAGLISINQRFNGLRFKSNEYYILPISDAEEDTVPSAGNALPSAGDALPSAGNALPLVQEMHYPSASDAPYLHVLNNNQINNNHLTSSSSMHAAAASILAKYAIDTQRLNGQAENMAAWLVYALTQPGLKNPVGYAMTRIKHGEIASDVFQEIVNIDIEWEDLPTDARNEKLYRQGSQGIEVYAELENVSDDALDILCKLVERKP